MSNLESEVQILTFDLEANITFLEGVSGFTSADREVHHKIAQLMQKQSWPIGATIFEQDEASEALYLIEEGTVSILKDDIPIATLGPKQFFGEIGILDGEKRGATVKTSSHCLIYLIPGFMLRELTKMDRNFEFLFKSIIARRT